MASRARSRSSWRGTRRWASACSCAAGSPELLVTDNETNVERLMGVPNRAPYVKDGIGARIVDGRRGR